MIRIFLRSGREIVTPTHNVEEVAQFIEDNTLFYVEESVKGVYLVKPSAIDCVLEQSATLAKVMEMRAS